MKDRQEWFSKNFCKFEISRVIVQSGKVRWPTTCTTSPASPSTWSCSGRSWNLCRRRRIGTSDTSTGKSFRIRIRMTRSGIRRPLRSMTSQKREKTADHTFDDWEPVYWFIILWWLLPSSTSSSSTSLLSSQKLFVLSPHSKERVIDRKIIFVATRNREFFRKTLLRYFGFSGTNESFVIGCHSKVVVGCQLKSHYSSQRRNISG